MTWIEATAALLRGARLGQQWVDPRPLAAHLAVMRPEVHGGLLPAVAPESTSGLPGYLVWQRVVADRAVAAAGRAALGDEAALKQRAETRGLPVDHRQLARAHYYEALLAAPGLVLDAVDVRVRRRTPEAVHLQIVLDKVEADGRFVRIGALVAQAIGRGLVEVTDDLVGSTGALRDVIFRQAGLDVELLWVALADQPGLTIERLERGVLGPVYQAGWPAPWPERPAGPILACALEQAALDLAADHDGDPLAPATPPLLAARARYGFRVSRERRFVVPPHLEAPLKQWCRQVGRPSVVRAVPV